MFVVEEFSIELLVSFCRKSQIGQKVEERVRFIINQNINQGKCTSIAVSGSSQPVLLGPIFLNSSVDWKWVHFYFSDERCVGLEDPDSNYASWNKHFFIPVSYSYST